MDTNVLEYRKRILNRIFENISLTGRENLVDVGCGDGGDCDLFLENVKEAIGVDINFNPNWRKTKKGNIEFLVADASYLPFKDEAFDVVFEKDALHHIFKNYRKVLEEMKRVAKEGGRVVVVEANRYNPVSYLHMTLIKGHQHFNKGYFENLLAGYFSDITFKSVESHVYPMTNKYLVKGVHFLEDFMAKVPLVKSFLSYNIAISQKNG